MNRRLRVMVDLTEVRPGGETGGAKYFVFEFLRRLAQLPDYDFTFAYLTNSAVHHEVMRCLVRIRDEAVCVRAMPDVPMPVTSLLAPRERVWFPPPSDLGYALKADVVYCPFGSVDYASPGLPCVVFVADLLHRDYPQTLPPDGISHRENLFIRAARRAQFFQCNSRFVVERLMHHFVIPIERTFHTYNVIHDRLDHAGVAGLPPALDGRPYFFYPANAWVHKNHEGLLIAYRTYRARHGSAAWPLVLSGHDDERSAAIRRWAGALALGASVHFVGHVTEAELSTLWRHAGALVFPSLHEGFGIPLVEAMHFGIPIAAAKCGSVPEIAGDAALYFDPYRPEAIAEAMLHMAEDAALRRRLVDAGASRLQALCADEGVRKLAQHLEAAAQAWPVADFAGTHIDGWVGDRLVLGLPPTACEGGDLQIDYVDHSPMIRLTIDAGHRPLGTFVPRDFPEKSIRLPLRAGTRVVVLRVVGGENLNPADPRIHGLRVRQVAFHAATVPTSEVIFRVPA